MPWATGAITVTAATPAEVADDGGTEIMITGTFREEVAAVELRYAGIGYLCYAAKRGEGYSPFPRSPTVIIVAAPILPVRGVAYDVRVTQTAFSATLAAAVTARARVWGDRVFDFRRLLPPKWRTGPRALNDTIALVSTP